MMKAKLKRQWPGNSKYARQCLYCGMGGPRSYTNVPGRFAHKYCLPTRSKVKS